MGPNNLDAGSDVMHGDATRVDVAVLGAGPAGLAAAVVIAEAGRSVCVIEAAPHVGGMTASVEVAGMSVDLGSHRLHRSIRPDLLAALRDELGDELQLRARSGRVRLDDRWLTYPLRPTEVMRRAPLPLRVGVVADLVAAPLRRPHADTFAELVRCGPGPTVLEHFYRPYARKLWGLEPEQLSGELFRRRVSARSPVHLAARVVRPGRSSSFWYPRRGFGQIAEALSERLVRSGGRLELGRPVRSLRHGDGAWTVPARPGGAGGAVRADLVLSTLPPAVLASAAGAPDDVMAAARSLRTRAMVLVYLVVERPSVSTFDAHYLPDESLAVARVSEPKNYRSGPDPGTHTVLCAELPDDVGGPLWVADDASLAEQVSDELRRVGFGSLPVIGHHVVRLPSVYPVYDLSYAGHQKVFTRWVAGTAGLVSVGRQALFAHDNTHHALAMGHAAGELAVRGWDSDEWASSLRRFEDHVVED